MFVYCVCQIFLIPYLKYFFNHFFNHSIFSLNLYFYFNSSHLAPSMSLCTLISSSSQMITMSASPSPALPNSCSRSAKSDSTQLMPRLSCDLKKINICTNVSYLKCYQTGELWWGHSITFLCMCKHLYVATESSHNKCSTWHLLVPAWYNWSKENV